MTAARRHKPLRLAVLTGLAACGFSFAASLSGCAGRENAVEDKGTDTAYLRFPGQKEADIPPNAAGGPLFPVSVGSRWEMETSQGPWKAASTKERGQVKITRRSSEVIKVTKQTILSGQPGAVFDIVDADPGSGIPTTRQEVYSVTEKGVFLLAAGGKAGQMAMSPPLPLVAYPPKEGETVQWSGVIHYKNATVPASSVSRLSADQMVITKALPKGVAAYRVDTIISTTLDSGQVSFPTTRWLAPGIGMVRQKLIAGDQLMVKELKSFEITRK